MKALSLFFVSLIILASIANAEVPEMISYQAILTDPDGEPIQDQDVALEFRIYSASVGGDELWMEAQVGTTNDFGGINIVLGIVTPIPGVVFDEPDRWLGVRVDADPEIFPRTRLISSPYAYQASRADVAAIALSGPGNGWEDDGTVVRLETVTDSVGIGTTTPDENLTVDGNAHVTGDLTVDGSLISQAGCWRHSGELIYNGLGPANWSTLDLSSFVGSNYAFVVIQVYQSNRDYFKFKPYGASGNWEKAGDADDYAANAGRIAGSGAGIVCLETDSQGRLEWHSGPGSGNYILTLLGYIR